MKNSGSKKNELNQTASKKITVTERKDQQERKNFESSTACKYCGCK